MSQRIEEGGFLLEALTGLEGLPELPELLWGVFLESTNRALAGWVGEALKKEARLFERGSSSSRIRKKGHSRAPVT